MGYNMVSIYMKRAIIIHCWEGYPNYCWYPQAKKELEAKGFEVVVPVFPETANPKLTGWLPKLQQIVGTPTEETYLIGHSLGCITIMRYFESLPDDQKVGGVVFVAGFTDDLDYKELSNFFEEPINFAKIKIKANYFLDITSDNDPYVALKYSELLKEKLGAKIIVKHGMKHFSGEVDGEESCVSLPDVVEAIFKQA